MYVDNHVIAAELVEELYQKSTAKEAKTIVSGVNMNTLIDVGTWTYGVFWSGLGRNSIFAEGCKHQVQKRQSGVCCKVIEQKDFRFDKCHGLGRPTGGSPSNSITVEGHTLEFGRARSAWGKCRELLSPLTNNYIHVESFGKIFDVCV